MDGKTTIYLSPEESLLFVEYQKRYQFMKLLESIDAFSMKNGSITIHFDNLGGIAKVEKNQQYKLAPTP